MNTPTIPKILPSEEDIALAREAEHVLSVIFQTHAETQRVSFHDENGTAHTVLIPTLALRLLFDALTEIGQGNTVSIISTHAVLTTHKAANVLGVSRPFLIKLLEKGEIPFYKVGTHRRVRYQDVIVYKNRIDAERRRALDELVAQVQGFGMGR